MDRPYRFRTYGTPPPQQAASKGAKATHNSRGYGPPSRLPLWQVARATSAAPKYFAPIEIQGYKKVHLFKDGGFGCSNPTREIYNDVVHKHGERGIGPFVSIGTGETVLRHKRQRNHIRDTILNIRIATKLPARTIKVHEEMESLSRRDNFEFPYFRFDGGEELGDIALDEWKSHKRDRLGKLMGSKSPQQGQKTLERISGTIDRYLADERVKRELGELAKSLVETRRLKVRDASGWDRYASFSCYRCRFQKCENPRLKTADDFRDHLERRHRFNFEPHVMDRHVREGRRLCWTYRQGAIAAA